MKRFHSLSIALVLAACSGLATAASFPIAGGGGAKNGSVYSQVVADIAGKCSTDDTPIAETQTSGGVQNLELLKGNQVKAAVVPSDVLFAAKLENASSVAQIKTLFGLYPESVHLIVRADTKIEGGTRIWGTSKVIGGNDVAFNQAEDLRGRMVGAVGGSVVTAKVLASPSMLKIGWIVKEYGSTSELVAALTKHEVDAIVIVAGAPSDAVKKIQGSFKLLAIRGNSDTAVLYQPTKLGGYSNLGGATVDTVSEQALMVTRQWKSQAMIDQLSALRSCFYKSVPEIQDTTGTHPIWQLVQGDEQADKNGKWAWYDLPSDTKAVAASPVKKAPKK